MALSEIIVTYIVVSVESFHRLTLRIFQHFLNHFHKDLSDTQSCFSRCFQKEHTLRSSPSVRLFRGDLQQFSKIKTKEKVRKTHPSHEHLYMYIYMYTFA